MFRICFNLQRTIENLKAENVQLKVGGLSPCPSPGPSSSVSQASGLTTLGGSLPRQSVTAQMPKSCSRGLSEGSNSGTVLRSSLCLSVMLLLLYADRDIFEIPLNFVLLSHALT